MAVSKVSRGSRESGVKGIDKILKRLSELKKLGLNLPSRKVYFVRAPIFRRILAFIGDLFIFDFVTSPLKNVIYGHFTSPFTFAGSYASLFSYGVVLSFLFFLYNFLFQYKLGQTPGMMLLQIRLINSGEIVDAVKMKTKTVVNAFPSFNQIFFRNIIFVPVFPLVLMWVFDPIFLVFKKERLSDRFLRLGVVQEIYA
ncbi:RDD family protein [Candidatus Woesearchaeota archaeon]|nr:RDD family protein [Candidatus Woesearchaeota archaeon]